MINKKFEQRETLEQAKEDSEREKGATKEHCYFLHLPVLSSFY